jgi:hypothetical protein
MTDQLRDGEQVDLGDEVGNEGGKTAPGDDAGARQQLDSAGGGYGSHSGTGSSGGTGDGDPGADSALDDGTTTGSGGATGAGPTDWVRGERS